MLGWRFADEVEGRKAPPQKYRVSQNRPQVTWTRPLSQKESSWGVPRWQKE